MENKPDSVRINKRLAELGLASRREADALIEAGKVRVNGRPAELGERVTPEDHLELTGRTGERRYLAHYKGRGVITHSPAAGEVDIAAKLASDYDLTGISPVGRLDKDSEGLIILTNDGRVTGRLLDPAANVEKVYEVVLDRAPSNLLVKHMRQGVNIEGYVTKPATVEQIGPKTLAVTLTEGKKHQIRRMCAAFGFTVQRLTRVRVGTVELGKLKPNQFRYLRGEERADFLRSLGLS